jgi:hypothetical protein
MLAGNHTARHRTAQPRNHNSVSRIARIRSAQRLLSCSYHRQVKYRFRHGSPQPPRNSTAGVVSLASLALAARAAFSPPYGGFKQSKDALAFAVATASVRMAVYQPSTVAVMAIVTEREGPYVFSLNT